MKTIVVGLGNPILGDDGVGWRVAEEVARLIGPELQVDVEYLIGYQRAIVIDAFLSEEEPGSVIALPLEDFLDLPTVHNTSVHDTSLTNAMKLGRSLGAALPEDVMIVGVAARRIHDCSEELSPPLAEAVPRAAQLVLELAVRNITIL